MFSVWTVHLYVVTGLPDRNKWLWRPHSLRWKPKNTKMSGKGEENKKNKESVEIQKGKMSVKFPRVFRSLMFFLLTSINFCFLCINFRRKKRWVLPLCCSGKLKKSNPRWYTKKRKSGGIQNRMGLINRGRKKLRK